MSLSWEEWKKVLNQPKNLGLKAGDGTGIGKCLDAVDKKVVAFDTTFRLRPAEAAEHGAAAEQALDDLKRQCDTVINKHKKLFTTACAYLATVKVSADGKKAEIHQKLARLADYEHGSAEVKARRTAIQRLCAEAERELKAAEDMKELADSWAKFKMAFLAKVEEYHHSRFAGQGDFHEAVERVKLLNPAGAKPEGFDQMRRSCAGVADEIWKYAEGLTPPRFA